MMRRWIGWMVLSVAGAAASLAFAACGNDTAETLCEPGTEVFCKCRGGFDGTKTCGPDGNSFGECATPDGACPEIEETTTTDGMMTICIPDEDTACSCDNGDEGTKTCASDGLSFGDCMTANGACGTTIIGDKLLYATCSDASECSTGVCDGGYCTRTCETFEVCYDEENQLYGDCVQIPSGRQCAPYCFQQSDCAGFGAESLCGGAADPDFPEYTFAVCANWGDSVSGMPYGTLCDSDTGELFYLGDNIVVMPCDIGLPGVQSVCFLGECSKVCEDSTDCPEMDCTVEGDIGCCESDPDCN